MSIPDEQATYLSLLPNRLPTLSAQADVDLLLAELPPGVNPESIYHSAGLAWGLGFGPTLDALALCRLWGLERPYAVSGDMRQETWRVVCFCADVPDQWNTRIATEAPKFDAWQVSIELEGRPACDDLPGVVSGASPAYDLTVYAARVRRVFFLLPT